MLRSAWQKVTLLSNRQTFLSKPPVEWIGPVHDGSLPKWVPEALALLLFPSFFGCFSGERPISQAPHIQGHSRRTRKLAVPSELLAAAVHSMLPGQCGRWGFHSENFSQIHSWPPRSGSDLNYSALETYLTWHFHKPLIGFLSSLVNYSIFLWVCL